MGVCHGTAFIDDCGDCVGGSSGKEPGWTKDCQGVCRGNFFFFFKDLVYIHNILNELLNIFGPKGPAEVFCGICGADDTWTNITDCGGQCFGKKITNACGYCVGGLLLFCTSSCCILLNPASSV